jgi:hypothetical protein
MATTPNYGWVTPAPSNFVTNLPADFETFADAVDDTVKDLNPGTTAGDVDYYTSGTAKARLGIGTAGQVLTVNSGATAPEWATPSSGFNYSNSQVFNTSGTFTVPAGITRVAVLCIAGGGGGGGGGKGSSGSATGGSGGGGGVVSFLDAISVTPAATISVTVGSGGAGGTGATVSGNGGNGSQGGFSSFGSHLQSIGGKLGNLGAGSGSNIQNAIYSYQDTSTSTNENQIGWFRSAYGGGIDGGTCTPRNGQKSFFGYFDEAGATGSAGANAAANGGTSTLAGFAGGGGGGGGKESSTAVTAGGNAYHGGGGGGGGATTGTAGVGGAGGANTGGGGGGGGGSASGTGADGGAGGSGKVIVWY